MGGVGALNQIVNAHYPTITLNNYTCWIVVFAILVSQIAHVLQRSSDLSDAAKQVAVGHERRYKRDPILRAGQDV